MLQKKKVTVKKSTDIASPKASTRQRNVSEYTHAQTKDATDLITSSARKQKLSRSLPKNNGCVPAANFNATLGSVKDDTSTVCIDRNETIEFDVDSVEIKGFNDNPVHGTLFSPTFQCSKTYGGEISNGDFLKYFHHGDRLCHDNGNVTMEVDVLDENIMQKRNFNDDNNLAWSDTVAAVSSEISEVHFSMKNSKLDCADECDQEHVSGEICIDEEETEEELEFNPYFFIKNLPDLSSVVPAHRPVLLPKRTRRCPSTTLVLDLDETLVHSIMEPCEDPDFIFSVDFNMQKHPIYVRCRPHLREFMDRISGIFEVVIFTASQSIYAEQLLNVLDPKRKVFRHRVFRESCVFVNGNYLKDLTVLGRDLARVVIIDNSPQAFGFQVENGIPIESWYDDKYDKELLRLLPFLESLIGVEDVRPLIAEKFNLRLKIADADNPLITTTRRER